MVVFECSFCGKKIEQHLENPIERVECLRCFALIEFHLENTTTIGAYMILGRVLRKGEGKYARNDRPTV